MSTNSDLAVQIVEATPTQPWHKPRAEQRRDALVYLALAVVAYAIVMVSGIAGPDGFALVFFIERFFVREALVRRNQQMQLFQP